MTARAFQGTTKAADVERSTEDIRSAIAKEEENISRTIEQIGERVKEKLDWREYVKRTPYWALGTAAGLGFIASRLLMPRATAMDRIIRCLSEELHDSLGSLRAAPPGPGLIKVTLLALVTKAAAEWIQNAATPAAASSTGGLRPRKGYVVIRRPKAGASKTVS